MKAKLKRALAAFVAFAAGWLIYMIAMVLTVYDGLLSIIFQPIMAGICSGLCVGAALVLGLLVKLPGISTVWKTRIPGIVLIIGSVFVMCFGYSIGLTQVYKNYETDGQFTSLNATAAFSSYFALIFAIANWPFRNGPATAIESKTLSVPPVIGVQ